MPEAPPHPRHRERLAEPTVRQVRRQDVGTAECRIDEIQSVLAVAKLAFVIDSNLGDAQRQLAIEEFLLNRRSLRRAPGSALMLPTTRKLPSALRDKPRPLIW